jgi:hypothetical protein
MSGTDHGVVFESENLGTIGRKSILEGNHPTAHRLSKKSITYNGYGAAETVDHVSGSCW